jgi:hypothetical protein
LQVVLVVVLRRCGHPGYRGRRKGQGAEHRRQDVHRSIRTGREDERVGSGGDAGLEAADDLDVQCAAGTVVVQLPPIILPTKRSDPAMHEGIVDAHPHRGRASAPEGQVRPGCSRIADLLVHDHQDTGSPPAPATHRLHLPVHHWPPPVDGRMEMKKSSMGIYPIQQGVRNQDRLVSRSSCNRGA